MLENDEIQDVAEETELIEEDDLSEELEYDNPYAHISAKMDNDEELSEEDINAIADLYVQIIVHILTAFEAEDSQIDEYIGDENELIFDVINPDLAVLIGRHGRTLKAFQQIVTTIANGKLGFRYPVVIDVESYKNRRKKKLESIAISSAEKAVEKNTPIKMKPMSAYDRRLVHIALRNFEGIETKSEGSDPSRRIVIVPISED